MLYNNCIERDTSYDDMNEIAPNFETKQAAQLRTDASNIRALIYKAMQRAKSPVLLVWSSLATSNIYGVCKQNFN